MSVTEGPLRLAASLGGASGSRTYSLGSFQRRLEDWEELLREMTFKDVEATSEERRQMITEHLRFDKFSASIRALFGDDIKNQDLKSIYRKISTNPDAKVDWSELFGYFNGDTETHEGMMGEEVNVFTVSSRKRVGEAAGDRKRRDIVVCIRYIPSMDGYLVASQKGTLSIWTGKLRLQACTDIHESAWVTGADYLPNIRRVAVCTERSICIWDNRTKGKNQPVFTIKPIEHSPQCLTWVPHVTSPHEDTLLFGDDQGYLNLLTLSAKDMALKNDKGDKRYTQSQTLDPAKLTHPIRRRRFHDDWVTKVTYYPDLRCFASCSPSSTNSFVLEEIDRILDNTESPRKVDVSKGVNAFTYCARANILATGGVDKIIRVWHPHIFSRPTGKLIGHLFTIVDISSNEKDQHIISLSTARVFRIWDIHTLTSLQVFTDNDERPGEKRIYSMLFNDKHDHLLTGSSVLDCWPLTRSVQDVMQVPHTHDRPIGQILYNPELNQLVTVCTEPSIRVWEAETGKQVYQITEPHGPQIEVTAIALDKTGYRLATGALNGSIRVWDFGSGQEIKWKAGRGTDDDLSLGITGLQYCTLDGERHLVAMGWNNRVKLLLDSNNSYDLSVLHDFSDIHYITREVSMTSDISGQGRSPLPSIASGKGSANITNLFRKDYLFSSRDLTCMTSLLPDLIVTGCSNGDIIMWDITKSQVNRVLTLTNLDDSPASSAGQGHRRPSHDHAHSVTCLSFLVHKERRLDPAYIKSLTKSHSTTEDTVEEGEGEESPSRRVSCVSSRHQSASHSVSGMTGDDTGRPLESSATNRPGSEVPMETGRSSQQQDTAQNLKENEDVQREDEDIDEAGRQSAASDIDPEARMIVDTYEAVLVSCHQDSFIRFWTLEGQLIREVTAMTRRQGSAVTAMCHDPDCNILVTGDQKGYLTLWDIGAFLKDPLADDMDAIRQVVCWRGHLTRVVHMDYLNHSNVMVSGGTDGSVRLWWGRKGRFIGFFGQHRRFNVPNDDTSSTPVLPYDITEGPLAPVKDANARQKLAQKHYEYPLAFAADKWRPFRRSAYSHHRSDPLPQQPQEKFFEALIKPKAYNTHLESFTTGEMTAGAVFRALPVYRVLTPSQPRTPELSLPTTDDDDAFQMFGDNKKRAMFAIPQGGKTGSKTTREGEKTRRKSRRDPPVMSFITPRSRQTSAATTTVSQRRR